MSQWTLDRLKKLKERGELHWIPYIDQDRSFILDDKNVYVARQVYKAEHAILMASAPALVDELIEALETIEKMKQTPAKGLTYEEIVIACNNVGVDLDCAACAECFFTGSTTALHSCQP